MYEFNLLVSCRWGEFHPAKKEIGEFLERLGDESPEISPTIAKGIIGVKTRLDPFAVIEGLQELFDQDPLQFRFTLKWSPVEIWAYSDLDPMKEAVQKLRHKIRPGERWRMTVEKRRYTRYHRKEIIRELAELIEEKVDLEHPDKILRVDVLGKYAGISVLEPKDTFSITKLGR